VTSSFVSCRIEGCKLFGKIEYMELERFRRHLAQDHDRYDLFKLAYEVGIIYGPIRHHNHSFVIQQIAEISKMPRKLN